MTMPAGQHALRESARQVAALWRGVLSRPQHPAGCTCMGHFLIPAMNAADLESDILDYMRARYAAEGVTSLVALLDARAAIREAGGPPFRAWLTALPDTGTPSPALARFLEDLGATLSSFGGDDGGTSRLFCT